MRKGRIRYKKDRVIDQLDTSSVVSFQSDESDAQSSIVDVEDESALQNAMDRINTSIDSLYSKRTETRVKALRTLIDLFGRHYLYLDNTWNYVNTLLDLIENILKRGKIHDQILACDLLTIFCFQFDFSTIQSFYARFLPILEPIVRDTTISCAFRTCAVTALAMFQSFSGYCDFVMLVDILKTLESIFKCAGLYKNGQVPVFDASATTFHITALRGWTFIYTFLVGCDVDSIGEALLPILINLLKSSSIDLRIAAGETCAIIYERLRNEVDDEIKAPCYKDLISLFKELSVDCSKRFSKGHLQKQHHSFRDLFDFIAHNTSFELSVNFGKEVLVLATKVDRFRYNYVCSILSGGLHYHLRENIQIRDLFNLGLVLSLPSPPSGLDQRVLRDQRKLEHCSASRIRTKTISTFRDKRNEMLSEIN